MDSRPALFLSHAHADNKLCDRYAAALRTRGFDVWYDRDNLMNGRVLSAEIERELELRSVLVVLLSATAVNSMWVRLEIGAFLSLAAQDTQRVLLPVRIGQCEIPLLLRGIAYIDAIDQPVERVADDIARALGGGHRARGTRTVTTEYGPPSGRARILALANQKGRTGKTTTAINLAAYLANAGRKTLVVDLSPDADATVGLGVNLASVTPSIYELLVAGSVDPKEAIKTEVRPNLSLLPSKQDLYAAELEMVFLDEREHRLRNILKQVVDNYEVILIDCPSSLALLTFNAIATAHGVIVPEPCEFFSLTSFQQLLNMIQLVKTTFNSHVFLFGIMLTMFNPRSDVAKEVADEISQHFPRERFQTIIPSSAQLAEAPSYGKTIFEYDGRSAAARAYRQLSEEVIKRLAKMEGIHA